MENHPEPYEPCPCGSGKKYKFCCLKSDRAKARSGGNDFSGIIPFPRTEPRDLFSDPGGQAKIDKGMRLMMQGHFGLAGTCFQEVIAAFPDNPAGYNNLAMSRFMGGNLEEAIAIQTRVMTSLPIPNAFGMAQMVHFLLLAGEDAAAEEALEGAVEMALLSPFALSRTCQSLTLFSRHETILELISKSHYEPDAALLWYAGIAAANLGQYERSCGYLKQAATRHGFDKRAGQMLQRIGKGAAPYGLSGEWPYLFAVEIVPQAMTARIGREMEGEEAPLLLKSRAVVDMAVAILNENGGTSTDAVEIMGRFTHPRATEVLVKIAEGTFGTDDIRMTACRKLIERGAWSKDEPHTIWMKGGWAKMLFQEYISTQQPASSHEIPEKFYPAYEKALEAGRSGKWKSAEKQWRELLAEVPDHPPFHFNLAISLMKQKRNEAEAERHLRTAMELEPEYLFPPAHLAILYASRGEVGKAREILAEMVVPKETPSDALMGYFSAQIQVCIAEKNLPAAVHWLKMGRNIDPEYPAIAMLEKKLKGLETLVDSLHAFVSRKKEKEEKQRLRVLPADASLEQCFAVYSKMALANIMKILGRDVKAIWRKAELLDRVCRELREPASCRYVVEGLGHDEKSALRDLLAAGGRLPYAEFTRKHGMYSNVEPGSWGVVPPETPADNLRSCGLTVEAIVDHRECVMISPELPITADWLASPDVPMPTA